MYLLYCTVEKIAFNFSLKAALLAIIAVDKAIGRMQKNQIGQENNQAKGQDFFFVKSDRKIIAVQYNDFHFAEAQGNYIKLVSSNNTILANMPFGNFEKLLPEDIFVRVHRSFIINKSKISHIEGNTVTIGKVEIPIGSNYRERLIISLRL
jgi:DNA-binding LytR/AlgR family response regulator